MLVTRSDHLMLRSSGSSSNSAFRGVVRKRLSCRAYNVQDSLPYGRMLRIKLPRPLSRRIVELAILSDPCDESGECGGCTADAPVELRSYVQAACYC